MIDFLLIISFIYCILNFCCAFVSSIDVLTEENHRSFPNRISYIFIGWSIGTLIGLYIIRPINKYILKPLFTPFERKPENTTKYVDYRQFATTLPRRFYSSCYMKIGKVFKERGVDRFIK